MGERKRREKWEEGWSNVKKKGKMREKKAKRRRKRWEEGSKKERRRKDRGIDKIKWGERGVREGG